MFSTKSFINNWTMIIQYFIRHRRHKGAMVHYETYISLLFSGAEAPKCEKVMKIDVEIDFPCFNQLPPKAF